MTSSTELDTFLKKSRKYKFQNKHDFCSVILKTDIYILDKIGGNTHPKKYNILLHREKSNRPLFVGCLDPSQALIYFKNLIRKDKIDNYL